MMEEPSSARVDCEHASCCPGCPLIELAYGEQLERKSADVARATNRYRSLAKLPVLAALGAEPITGYRTRAKLVVGEDGSLGLYEDGKEHAVVDIPECRVLSPALALVAKAIRARLKQDVSRGARLWRAVDLRETRSPGTAEARTLVTLVVERSEDVGLESLREAAEALARETPTIAGVAVSFHDGKSPRVLGSETMHLFGEIEGKDFLGASVQNATFGAFAQAHRGQARRVHELIAGTVPVEQGRPAPRVLDLYGGSGAIALTLASAGAEALLVESYEPAATLAKRAALEQGLSLEVMPCAAASALAGLVKRKSTFDLVVVNPPRRGMGPETRRALAALDPRAIAYVSCDPTTLARDLDHLARLGFGASELQPVDMIPLTEHTEVVVFLRRGKPPAPLVLFEDDDVVAIEKAPHEPTTPQGEHTTSLLARVQKLPRLEAAVPIHRLDVGTSGVVLFARDTSRVHAWAQAIGSSSAQKTYVALVRGETLKKGKIERPLEDGKRTLPATTLYRKTDDIGGHSLIEVFPQEGRTHQIRRHFAAIRHPVLGDGRYGHPSTNRHFEEKHGLDRTFLHAARLEFRHPRTRRPLVIESKLAGDLEAVLERMRADARRRRD
jgi:23S rRNA (uracil1939-C5)-methyltransferase